MHVCMFGRLQESLVKCSQMFDAREEKMPGPSCKLRRVSDIIQSIEVGAKKTNKCVDMNSLWMVNNHRDLLYKTHLLPSFPYFA